ncbi:MAG: dephospho-CoA kinase [Deltaproteobacteria bacterium]|nr:dephospho-CoA kinase [Deltaproteobacteria bacterium]
MKLIGLTGGIASGKSTAAAILRRLGAQVIDADALAREIVQPHQPAWEEIVETFGKDVLQADDTLDRKKLRTMVFANPEVRKQLEAITHPKIRRLAQQKIANCAAAGVSLVVYEAPLFFETNIHRWLRPVILVACDTMTQRHRLQQRDNLTQSEIEEHLGAQMSLEEKRKLADHIIENNGSLADLEKKVEALVKTILAT